LLEERLKGAAASAIPEPSIPLRPDRTTAPLSHAQERLWFIHQIEPGSPAYNQTVALHLSGALNVPALERSLKEIVSRHDTLRSRIVTIDGEPRQVIAPSIESALPVICLDQVSPTIRAGEAQRLTNEQSQKPFELAQCPLWRMSLLRLNDTEHTLLITLHHIVTDGWSSAILLRELATLYNAHAAGQPSPLRDLPLQYGDFAAWQRQGQEPGALDKQLAFWTQQLQGAPPLLELPSDRPRPRSISDRGSVERVIIGPDLWCRIRALCIHQGATPFMGLLAAFQTLLYRYTGQDDIVVGSAIANRRRTEFEHMIGFFANTLVFRTDLSGDPTFLELLERVRQVCLDAYAHQDLPFERLVEALQPDRDGNRSPLLQVMFVLQNVPRDTLQLAGLGVSVTRIDPGAASSDLSLSMTETSDALEGELRYRADLFDPTMIRRVAAHFLVLLESIANDPHQTISALPILPESEREQLLVGWNDTRQDLAQEACLHRLIERQVTKTPDVTAVRFRNQRLTYAQLNSYANQIAHYLCELGVQPETPVGMLLDRSPEMVAAVLGILKAGGAVLPLDPGYPQERLAFMLQDAQVRVVITRADLVRAPIETPCRTIHLDEEQAALARRPCTDCDAAVRSDNLACLIYTSGSTGRPKAVMVEHRGLCNFALARVWPYQPRPGSRCLHSCSVSFDISVGTITTVLCAGATLELAPDELLPPGAPLVQFIRDRRITHLSAVPSLLAALPEAELPDLEVVEVGGEPCPPALPQRWAPGRVFVNAYGPTETTVASTVWLGSAHDPRPPIGRPIANTQIYILDSHMQPVPIGVPGEIYIGGVGVARGYLNLPDTTAERFLPDPFMPESSSRIFRTGDLGRYRSDGNIEFLGRLDRQVKVRGYRIELGEIEAWLEEHPQVTKAVVVLTEAESGDHRLVAYVVCTAAPPPPSHYLRLFLRERLPRYMVPSSFVLLDELPLTRNGKLDLQALPQPGRGNLGLDESAILPHTSAECTIARIWQDVLGIDRVGVHDNFFDLGGHSLLAMQVVARLENEFGVRVNPRELVMQTLGQLALSYEERQRAPGAVASRSLRERLRAAIHAALGRRRV